MSSCDDTSPVAVACSLDHQAQHDRLAEWSAVLANVIDRTEIDGGVSLHFAADASFVGGLADLVVREQQCCPFFSFRIVVDAGGVALDIVAPVDARPVIDALIGTSD